MDRIRRYGGGGSLLVIDLDHRKPINDSFGHGVGDQILRAVASAITGRVRATDVVGRLGGDEFVVLLCESSAADARTTADCLLSAIAAIEIETEAGSARTSTSIGATRLETSLQASISELLVRADAAMYQAKRACGNQSASADTVPATAIAA